MLECALATYENAKKIQRMIVELDESWTGKRNMKTDFDIDFEDFSAEVGLEVDKDVEED
jgi:hypothetical protein